jgi:hypothetical protein
MTIFKKFLIISLSAFFIYIGIFLTIYNLKLNHLTLQSEDYLGSATLPFSLLYEGNFDLNEYYGELTKYYPQPDDASLTPYYLRKNGENYYSIRPIWTSLMALPVYIPARLFNMDVDIEMIRIMSRIGGAFIVALSVGIFYLISCKFLNSEKSKLFLTAIYAFGTNSLSTNSQGLWQHGTSQLLLSAAILTFLNKNYFLTGLLLGIATISRPTNLLSVVILGLYLLFIIYKQKNLSFRNYSPIFCYILGGLLAITAELILNKLLFGIADNAGYTDQLSGWRNNIFEGFAGLWFSPSKGIIPNSPILIFIFYGFYKLYKSSKKYDAFLIPSSLIVILHTFIMGWWYSWYGGYSWGYRMASDVLPFIILLLIPFIKDYFETKRLIFITYTLFLLSVLNHLASFIFFDGIWHTIYDGKSKYWLWSITNSEIVFDMKRLLYKFGLIKTNPIPFGY